MRRAAAVAAASLLAACAHPLRPGRWVDAEERFAPSDGFYEVSPPAGWMRFTRRDGRLIVTRDGTPLQWIAIGSTPAGDPIALLGNKRKVPAGLSPLEARDLVVDELRAGGGRSDVRVLESAPADVGGRAGFRVLAAYRVRSGAEVRVAAYGAMVGDRLHWAVYVAPARHYFAADLPTFEEVVKTLRIPAPPPRRA